jgi:carbamoyltransferase
MTQYLGFRPCWDEYKVMGLAALGDDRFYDAIKSLVRFLPDGQYELDLRFFTHHHATDTFFSSRMERLLGPRRPESSPAINPRYASVARASQMVLDDICLHVVSDAVSRTGIKDVCLSGGVAINGVMINRLRSELGLERIFVPPAPDDAGASCGAALAIWSQMAGEVWHRPATPCLSRVGPAFSKDEARDRLRDYTDLGVDERRDWITRVAELLASGQIVAWFQGPAEFGPRALGGRSILADPGSLAAKNRISSAIKDREGFRPFAASVIEERASEYFNLSEPTPYMIEVCDVREQHRRSLSAITHVDGTCRPQTVSRRANSYFWELLSEFGRLTGRPVLLNTSFNESGQAMVCTIDQAIDTFLRAPLDVLAIEGLIVTKGRVPKRSPDGLTVNASQANR